MDTSWWLLPSTAQRSGCGSEPSLPCPCRFLDAAEPLTPPHGTAEKEGLFTRLGPRACCGLQGTMSWLCSVFMLRTCSAHQEMGSGHVASWTPSSACVRDGLVLPGRTHLGDPRELEDWLLDVVNCGRRVYRGLC